jgi:Cupin-like domain
MIMFSKNRIRYDWLKMYDEAENTARKFPVNSIIRYKNPSVEFVLECISKSMPIILTDVMDTWKSVNWNFSYLQEKYGNVVIRRVKNRKILLGEHIKTILNGTCNTTGGLQLPNELRDDIDLPINSKHLIMGSASMFLGKFGGVTPLHRDAGNGLNAQIIGKKAWTLLSPAHFEALAPRFLDAFSGFQVCDVNLSDCGFHQDLLLRGIQPINVIIHPQEVLLVPSGWFHEVKLLEAAISIAFPVFPKI